MRFVWAVIAFVLAAALIGAGIAQRTVFLGPDEATMSVEVSEPQPYTLIDGDVFRANAGLQTLNVSGTDTIVLAYGRTADMEAWLADAPYTHVALDKSGDAVAESVPAAEPTYEGAFPGRSPVGADLWLDEYSSTTGSLSKKLQLPEGVSVLLASDGVAAAPADISIVWPISNATPWAGPLIVLGGILLLAGVILYILGVRHVRRSRGPRRKGRALPPSAPRALGGGRRRAAVTAAPVEPPKELTTGPEENSDAQSGSEEASDANGTDETPKDEGRSRRGRRSLIALPAMGLTVALLTGCSPEAWPQFEASPTPSPTPTLVAPENQQTPALTDAQAARIAQSIASTVADADAAMDPDLAATRLDGIALEMRKVNYTVRASAADYAAPIAIPGDSVEILLPQAFDEWPRSAMMIVEGAPAPEPTATPAPTESPAATPAPEATEDAAPAPQAPPAILTITQADPWSNYKVTTVANLEAGVEIPDLAPSWLGSSLVPPDSSFLQIAPDELAAAYADVIALKDQSQYAALFDVANDPFLAALDAARAETLTGFNELASETGEMTFGQAAGATDPIALATLESGAIVAVTIDTTIVTKPKEEGVVIKFEGNTGVVALTGEDQSSTGATETATTQLFFAVPAQGSTEPIRVLGYSSGLRSAALNPAP